MRKLKPEHIEVLKTLFPHTGSCTACGHYRYLRDGVAVKPSECEFAARHDHHIDRRESGWQMTFEQFRGEHPHLFEEEQ
jgi:hypothetical protein